MNNTEIKEMANDINNAIASVKLIHTEPRVTWDNTTEKMHWECWVAYVDGTRIETVYLIEYSKKAILERIERIRFRPTLKAMPELDDEGIPQ